MYTHTYWHTNTYSAHIQTLFWEKARCARLQAANHNPHLHAHKYTHVQINKYAKYTHIHGHIFRSLHTHTSLTTGTLSPFKQSCAIHTCTHTHTCTCTHTYTDTDTGHSGHRHRHIHTHINTQTYTWSRHLQYTHTCMHKHTHTRPYTHTYTYAHTSEYRYILHKHAHTHTNTRKHTHYFDKWHVARLF